MNKYGAGKSCVKKRINEERAREVTASAGIGKDSSRKTAARWD